VFRTFGLFLLGIIISIVMGSMSVAQNSKADSSTRTDRRYATDESDGCKKKVSKDALDQARDTARNLPDNDIGVFDSRGKLEEKVPLNGKSEWEAAKNVCPDLKPISTKCWICCSTGKIICKRTVSYKSNKSKPNAD
jgi:hypothetical protein